MQKRKMQIQYNYNSDFRIVAPNGETSRWFAYSDIATFELDGKIYIATSSYHRALPKSETVYEIEEWVNNGTEVDTETYRYIDRHGNLII